MLTLGLTGKGRPTPMKLSVAVHSSLAKILICQSCVHNFWFHNYKQVWPEIVIFKHFSLFSSVLKQNCTICLFLHFKSILAWFLHQLSLLSKKMVKPKMADPRWRLAAS